MLIKYKEGDIYYIALFIGDHPFTASEDLLLRSTILLS